jgi:glycosyltransferase involved in cell wall biosynthesis
MTSRDTRVSVVVLDSENYPDRLHQTLRCLQMQTLRPLEVVVVRMAETAPDEVLLRDWAGDLGLIVVSPHDDANRADAANAGWRAASGHQIAFMGNLDHPMPEHLALLSNAMSIGGHLACHSDVLLCRSTLDSGTLLTDDCQAIESRDFDLETFLLENHIPLSAVLLRREVLDELGGFDPAACPAEDWDLLVRVGQRQTPHHVRQTTLHCPYRHSRPHVDGWRERYGAWSPLAARHVSELMDRYRDSDNERRRLAQLLEEANRNLDSLHDEQQAPEEVAELNRRLDRMVTSEHALKARVEMLEAEISRIQSTRVWRAARIYWRLRKALHGDRSSTVLSRSLPRLVQIARSEGLAGLRKRLARRSNILQPIKADDYPYRLILEEDASIDATGPSLDVTVSVIIPTRNAGPGFERMVKRVLNQQGVRSIELIVIDSESGDDTLRIAREANATVMEIAAEQFHHGLTRNQAASAATGEVLVYTVQDALPAGPDWLYRLVQPLVQDRADAVSVRQIPRADADLYARYADWGFSQHLGFENDTVRCGADYPDYDRRPRQEKRRIAHLDNTCMAIRRDLFDRFRFEARYAEDLELGQRLMLTGHRLLHQVDNAVIHSHSRSPYYFFRRSFVDQMALDAIFESDTTSVGGSGLHAASWAYPLYAYSVERWLDWLDTCHLPPARALRELMTDIELAVRTSAVPHRDATRDHELSRLFETRRQEDRLDRTTLAGLKAQLLGELHGLSRYLDAYADWPCTRRELLLALHKAYGAAAGRFVAATGDRLAPELIRGI